MPAMTVHVPEQPTPDVKVEVNVPAQGIPDITLSPVITMPEQKTPEVTVNVQVPEQTPPDVIVNVPQQSAPDVTVNVKPEIVMPSQNKEISVKRDKDGKIIGLETKESE